MKAEIVKILVDNLEIIVSTITTLFLAWIKKKYDLRKLKKQGRLIDIDKINNNHKA